MLNSGFEIKCTKNVALLSGTMRLASPKLYKNYFSPIINLMSISKKNSKYIVDLTQLQYLNVAGLAALAHVVDTADHYNQHLTLIINNDKTWQHKHIQTFQQLFNNISIQIINQHSTNKSHHD